MDMQQRQGRVSGRNGSQARTGALAANNASEFLTFRLGAEEYGIDILRVQEIRSYEEPTRIANAPHFIKGVVNLRGVIVPVVDLRIKLGCEKVEYNGFTVVIVLNVHGRVVGAVVDSVSDVMELASRPDQAGAGDEHHGGHRLHHGHRQRGRTHADPDGHRGADEQRRHGPDRPRPAPAVTGGRPQRHRTRAASGRLFCRRIGANRDFCGGFWIAPSGRVLESADSPCTLSSGF